jgi:uncharacterized protein (DUF697 family)
MVTCREEALRWVHRYAAGGAVFAAVPLPVPTSPILAAVETHLVGVVAKIYGEEIGAPFAAAAGGTFTAVGTGLKFAATQAVGYIPIIGPVIRGTIAGVAIEAIGQAIVAHYERKFPGKVFTQTG